jgi:ABC-type transport system involved in multi-copper enzyme maturation permease subunit
MIRLLRAEWLKMTRQRWVTGSLLWVWPVGGLILCIVLGIGVLIFPVTRDQVRAFPFRWTDVALGTWTLPLNLFGRLLIIGYAVRQFAGEYQWGTWKHSVPYASRAGLLFAKYIVLSLVILLAFGALSIVLGIGGAIVNTLAGAPTLPTPTPDVIDQFIVNYTTQAGTTLIGAFIGAAFGALAAMLTRSMLGGIIGGVLFVLIELGFMTSVTVMGVIFNIPQVADLIRFTSLYNVQNVSNWIITGQPTMALVQGVRVNSVAESVFVLSLWMIGLVGASFIVFRRQDVE